MAFNSIKKSFHFFSFVATLAIFLLGGIQSIFAAGPTIASILPISANVTNGALSVIQSSGGYPISVGGQFTMQVHGTGFTSSSSIQISGGGISPTNLATTPQLSGSDPYLYASITAQQIMPAVNTSVTYTIKVVDNSTGSVSNGFSFPVTSTQTTNNSGTACQVDSDCGIGGSIDSSFCQNNSVYHNVINYTCINAGTQNASCQSSTASAFGYQCANNQNCSEGSCITNTTNDPPPPTLNITDIDPTSKTVGDGGFKLIVNGNGFNDGAVVNFGVFPTTKTMPTQVISSKQVVADFDAKDIATAGSYSITVSNVNPGPAASNALAFTVNFPPGSNNDPLPSYCPKPPEKTPPNQGPNYSATIDHFSPLWIKPGGPALTLTVYGSGFSLGDKITIDGLTGNNTKFASSEILSTSIPENAFPATNFGTASYLRIKDSNGNQKASPTFIAIQNVPFYPPENPVPSISYLKTPSIRLGQKLESITIVGKDFVPLSRWQEPTVTFNGQLRTIISGLEHTIKVQVLPSDIAKPGSIAVVVTNPPAQRPFSPGGGQSNPAFFTITDSSLTANPVPLLSADYVFPQRIPPGSPNTKITLYGVNFIKDSLVLLDGEKIPTTAISDRKLTAIIPAKKLENSHTYRISVQNPGPGGGTSGTASFNVAVSGGNPIIASVSPNQADSNPNSEAQVIQLEGPNLLPPGYGSSEDMARVYNYDPLFYGSFAGSFAAAYESFPLSYDTESSPGTTLGRFTLPAHYWKKPGTYFIQIHKGYVPGSGVSNLVELHITGAVYAEPAKNFSTPVVTSLSPWSVSKGGKDFTLKIYGHGFNEESVVQVGIPGPPNQWGLPGPMVYQNRPTKVISAKEIHAQIFASDIAVSGWEIGWPYGTGQIRDNILVVNPKKDLLTSNTGVATLWINDCGQPALKSIAPNEYNIDEEEVKTKIAMDYYNYPREYKSTPDYKTIAPIGYLYPWPLYSYYLGYGSYYLPITYLQAVSQNKISIWVYANDTKGFGRDAEASYTIHATPRFSSVPALEPVTVTIKTVKVESSNFSRDYISLPTDENYTYTIDEHPPQGALGGGDCNNGQEISAQTNCTFYYTLPREGTLAIIKNTEKPLTGNNFFYHAVDCSDGANCPTIEARSITVTVNGTSGSGTTKLNQGSYTYKEHPGPENWFSEAQAMNWWATNASCAKQDGSSTGTWRSWSRELAGLQILEDQTTTCVFNGPEVKPPPTGIIKITKNTNGPNDIFNFSISDTNSLVSQPRFFDLQTKTGTMEKSIKLPVGTYNITERENGNWKLKNASCLENGTFSQDPATHENNGISNISLADGQIVTCTFVNEWPEQTCPVRATP